MKIFVTGVNGQLGHDCMTELAGRGHEVTGSDIQTECELDMPYVPLTWLAEHVAVPPGTTAADLAGLGAHFMSASRRVPAFEHSMTTAPDTVRAALSNAGLDT